jgi:hypothetical protein
LFCIRGEEPERGEARLRRIEALDNVHHGKGASVRCTRHLVAATLTVVTVSSVTSAILPGSDSSRPSDGTYARQHANNHAQELSESRLRANLLGDAINADHLRSAESRAADAATGAAADALLRRP